MVIRIVLTILNKQTPWRWTSTSPLLHPLLPLYPTMETRLGVGEGRGVTHPGPIKCPHARYRAEYV